MIPNKLEPWHIIKDKFHEPLDDLNTQTRLVQLLIDLRQLHAVCYEFREQTLDRATELKHRHPV